MGVGAFLDRCGIKEIRTAYRSPWQNPYVDRADVTLQFLLWSRTS